jgi:hypothetical protein
MEGASTVTILSKNSRFGRRVFAFALGAGCLTALPVALHAEPPRGAGLPAHPSPKRAADAEKSPIAPPDGHALRFAFAGDPPPDRPDGPPGERRRRPRPPRDAGGHPPPPPHDVEPGDRPPPPPPDGFDPDMPHGDGFDGPPGPPPAGHDGPPRAGEPGRGPHGPQRGPMQLFVPRPQDWEPLSDAEREKLIQFAREKLPLLGQRLDRADDSDEVSFNRRFARDIAPHLRMLQRVYAEDAAMGELYRRHVEAFFRVQVLRIALRRAGDREGGRQRIEQDARRLFAEMVEVERAVIDRTLKKTAHQSDSEISARLEALLTGDEALDQSPPVRSAIRAYRAATTDEEKAERREIVRQRLAKEAEIEREGLQRMLDRLIDDGEEEVDRRVERLLNSADRPMRRVGPREGGPPEDGPPGDRRAGERRRGDRGPGDRPPQPRDRRPGPDHRDPPPPRHDGAP